MGLQNETVPRSNESTGWTGLSTGLQIRLYIYCFDTYDHQQQHTYIVHSFYHWNGNVIISDMQW